MSAVYLRLIPTDPTYVPTFTAQRLARERLATSLPLATSITSMVMGQTAFIDPGGNFESVCCPNCGMHFDDDLNWWQDAMAEAWQSHFADLHVAMPCCGATLSLNALAYDYPAGFARFMLDVRDPAVARLDAALLADLSRLLGCELRLIWAHY